MVILRSIIQDERERGLSYCPDFGGGHHLEHDCRLLPQYAPKTYQKIQYNITMESLENMVQSSRLERYRDIHIRNILDSNMVLYNKRGDVSPLDQIYLPDKFVLGHHGDRIHCFADVQFMKRQEKCYTLYLFKDNFRIRLVNPIICYLKTVSHRCGPTLHIRIHVKLLCDCFSNAPTYEANTVKRVILNTLKTNSKTRYPFARGVIIPFSDSKAEIKARTSLRDTISEKQWKKYLKDGFVMIQGKSGRTYQVFQNQRHTKVFECGNLIKELCIHTDKKCPPTDHILNMKVLIEQDEQAIWDNSNVYQPRVNKRRERHPKVIDNLQKFFNILKQDHQFLENRLVSDVEKQRQQLEDDFFREYE